MTRTAESPVGGHAVVLGGSLAGLCAARALARHLARVTLVERDEFPDGPTWRKGVPQARHTHNILGAGQNGLQELFPGLPAELVAAGMVEVRMPQDMLLMVPGGWVERFPSRHVVLAGSRDLLDHHIRRRLRQDPAIRWRTETEVIGLVGGVADSVAGVRLRDRDASAPTGWGEPYELAADLVIDATGRTSQAPQWLRGLGYDTPSETVVDPKTSYATCVFAQPPGHGDDWKCILLQSTPQVPRQGILNPIEGNRWMVSVTGMNGERPPLEHAGFVEFAKGLRSTRLYEAIRDAEPLGPVYGSGRTENRRRHYEKLRRWPAGFLPFGDAFGAFNPSYGQGISVATASALALDARLAAAGVRGSGRIPADFAAGMRKPISRCVDAAWALSANADLAYPWSCDGELPLPARLAERYMNRLLKVVTTDRTAAEALLDMTHLVASPAVAFRPRIVAAVLRGPRDAGPQVAPERAGRPAPSAQANRPALPEVAPMPAPVPENQPRS